MRVERLTITGFGCLHDRELRLGAGLTVVHGANEAGKSTTHAALRAGLFGLTAGGRRTRDETSALDRHRPWQGEAYGLVIQLSGLAGGPVRLEWDFDRPRYAVVDASTGADRTGAHGAGSDPRLLASTLYGVDRDVYLRVGCVDQAELHRIGDPGSVRHAVETALTRSRADTSALAAVEALRRHRSRLVGLNRARGNPLPVALAERDDLRERLHASAGARAELERAAAARDATAAAAEEAAERVHVLESVRGHLHADELRRRVAAAEELADADALAARTLAEHAGGEAFSPAEDLPALRGRMRDLAQELAARTDPAEADAALAARLEERAAELDARLAQLEPDRGAAERAPAVEAAVAAAHSRARPWGGIALVAAGIALALAGAVTGAVALVAAGAVAALAGAVAAFAAGRRGSSDLDRLLPGSGPPAERLRAFRAAVERDRELAAAERELAGVRVQAAEARSRMAGVVQVERELDGVRERIGAVLRERAIEADDLELGLAAYDRAAASAQTCREATLTRTRASGEVRRLLGPDSLEQARERLSRMEHRLNGHAELATGRDPDDVERELAAARSTHERAAAERERLAAAVAERGRALPDAVALREDLDAAEERVAHLTRVERVLQLAETELAAAAAETYRDFAPHLNAALEAGIARLTDGRYTRVFVGEELQVRLEAPETGAVVDLDQLSVGTQKQAYLVQRLAMIELLCPASASLPVLLDDPFAHFDAARLERTLAWLSDAARERQIIVFATQRRVAELAPAGATVIAL